MLFHVNSTSSEILFITYPNSDLVITQMALQNLWCLNKQEYNYSELNFPINFNWKRVLDLNDWFVVFEFPTDQLRN